MTSKSLSATLVWVDFSWCESVHVRAVETSDYAGGHVLLLYTSSFLDFTFFNGVFVRVRFGLCWYCGVSPDLPHFPDCLLGVLDFVEKPGKDFSSPINWRFSTFNFSTLVRKSMPILFNLFILIKQKQHNIPGLVRYKINTERSED